MGLDINLESERGEILATIGDPQNLLHRLLERSIPDEPQIGGNRLVEVRPEYIR